MQKHVAYRVWAVFFTLWTATGFLLWKWYGIPTMLAWYISALVFPQLNKLQFSTQGVAHDTQIPESIEEK